MYDMAQSTSESSAKGVIFANTVRSKGLNENVAGYKPDHIRNICILAHVDHGKTSIADCILTLSGLVNKRYVGKTKYLDDRPDEQERKITMKCSCASIECQFNLEGTNQLIPLLINLVDTPGHIDFTTEVAAAVRISDGALIVVDVVEGLSSQTKLAIKYAYKEKMSMILIINKIDRLIIDLQLNTHGMSGKIFKLVEDCNLYVSTLQRLDVNNVSHLSEDENMFNPILGNVIFASAIDGWGFTLRDIAKMYIHLTKGETVESLTEKLWEIDYYICSKDKYIKTEASKKSSLNVFAQLVCCSLHYIYTTLVIKEDPTAIPKILKRLQVYDLCLPLQSYGFKTKLKIIMETWKPLAFTIAQQCFVLIASPANLTDEKIRYLVNEECYIFNRHLLDRLRGSMNAIRECSSSGPLIAYISKLVAENINNSYITTSSLHDIPNFEANANATEHFSEEIKNIGKGEIQIMALVRIYSGKIYANQELFAITNEYTPKEFLLTDEPRLEALQNGIRKMTVKHVYVLLGPECKCVDTVGAGYVCGITCTEEFPFPIATLCDSFCCPPFIEQQRMEPLMLNVITPIEPKHSSVLRCGLQLLQKYDTCLKTYINQLGEYVVITAGTVHLEKCITDLKTNFIDIPISVSDPIYSLRETVVQNVMLPISKTLEITPLCKIYLEISVVALPDNIANVLHIHHGILNMIQNQEVASILDICARASNNQLHQTKAKTFTDHFNENVIPNLKYMITEAIRLNHTTVWNSVDVMKIIRVGSTQNYINIILNDVRDYHCNLFTTHDEFDSRIYMFNIIINAFNTACDFGPICNEPVTNCAFIMKEFKVIGDIQSVVSNDPHICSHITQQVRELFHNVILKEDIAIMEPLMGATVQSVFADDETKQAALGSIMAEINKHNGRKRSSDEDNNYRSHFYLKAFIPAIHGEGFVNAIRKIHSGIFNITLAYHHYELTNVDQKSKRNGKGRLDSRAQKLVKDVRLRKGLPVYDQVVVHAEKQRTLKK